MFSNTSSRPSGLQAGLRELPGPVSTRRRWPLRGSSSHTLQPGDLVSLRGGRGTDSDAGNVVYRQNCNFIWNNDKDTIYFYKPTGARADVHAYTKSANDRDGNGYITYHG